MRRCPSNHRGCWVFSTPGSSHYVLWCYQCGAVRFMPDDKAWTYPTGIGGHNPAMKESFSL